MFGNDNIIRIDLHLPTAWNRCTTEELEAIAAAIIQEQQRVDRYHPFDWSRVKLSVVLAVNSITVLRDNDITKGGDASDTEWLVRRPDDKEPWSISVGQLLSLTEMLAWIDDEKASKIIFQFPYMQMTVGERTLQGPRPLLDGYTWKEYRWMTDWMTEYIRCNNAMEKMNNDKARAQNQAALDRARNEFLALMFKPKDDAQPMFNIQSSMFNDFSPIKWQVVLFWWSSLMQQLSFKFPKVFKSSNIGKKRNPRNNSPWDFYNLVTATVQKYIGGLSSQDVDNQPYGVTLQQLEMMADEAAEMEKLKRK